MIKFSKSHEYVRLEDNVAYIGISDYAQSELGEIVFVDFNVYPTLNPNTEFGSIEAVKAVSELYSPVSCIVLELNENINDRPETVNEDAEGAGWLLKVDLVNPAELDDLMSKEEYEKYIKQM